ncbi:hypothetical protein [Methylobacterium sp. CCH5-D2]|uniref:hypothetical protein n=1 Tax=Methylobacterium sp. CCH5-D2 TaxID=1768765 RepID=UPI0009ECA0B4|nr:hypothetical protein [Methylobacterium sp. CCH5-D2]
MPDPTTGDLSKAGSVHDDELIRAVDAVLAKPETGPYPIGGGYLLDFAAKIEAHEPSANALADPEAKPGWRRTAILMARPVKG